VQKNGELKFKNVKKGDKNKKSLETLYKILPIHVQLTRLMTIVFKYKITRNTAENFAVHISIDSDS